MLKHKKNLFQNIVSAKSNKSTFFKLLLLLQLLQLILLILLQVSKATADSTGGRREDSVVIVFVLS